jgi:hypothetical protein
MKVVLIEHTAAVVIPRANFCYTMVSNKTRQGYVRKHILKPAGYLFVDQALVKSLSW